MLQVPMYVRADGEPSCESELDELFQTFSYPRGSILQFVAISEYAGKLFQSVIEVRRD